MNISNIDLKDKGTKKKIAKAFWIFFAVLPIYSIGYGLYNLYKILGYNSNNFILTNVVHFLGDMIGIILVYILVGIFYLNISKIFHAIYNDVPIFDMVIVKRVKTAAIMRLLIYIFLTVMNILPYIFFSSMISLSLKTVIGFFTSAMPALTFICLAYVFDYGAAMQRESDETL